MATAAREMDEQELDLSVDDLEVEDVEVEALKTDGARGVPEMGASICLVCVVQCSCCVTV